MTYEIRFNTSLRGRFSSVRVVSGLGAVFALALLAASCSAADPSEDPGADDEGVDSSEYAADGSKICPPLRNQQGRTCAQIMDIYNHGYSVTANGTTYTYQGVGDQIAGLHMRLSELQNLAGGCRDRDFTQGAWVNIINNMGPAE